MATERLPRVSLALNPGYEYPRRGNPSDGNPGGDNAGGDNPGD